MGLALAESTSALALDSKLSGAAESYSGSTGGAAESYYNSGCISGTLEGLSDRRKQ